MQKWCGNDGPSLSHHALGTCSCAPICHDAFALRLSHLHVSLCQACFPDLSCWSFSLEEAYNLQGPWLPPTHIVFDFFPAQLTMCLSHIHMLIFGGSWVVRWVSLMECIRPGQWKIIDDNSGMLKQNTCFHGLNSRCLCRGLWWLQTGLESGSRKFASDLNLFRACSCNRINRCLARSGKSVWLSGFRLMTLNQALRSFWRPAVPRTSLKRLCQFDVA